MTEVRSGNEARETNGRATGGGSMSDGGGIQIGGVRRNEKPRDYRKLVEYGDGRPLDAGILWTRQRVNAVLWGGQGKGMGARRRMRRKWNPKRRAGGREVGKGNILRSECGGMHTRYRSRGEGGVAVQWARVSNAKEKGGSGGNRT